MADENICYLIGCTNPAPNRCARCQKVHYCSVAHQRQDWKAGGHKQNCNRYQLIERMEKAGKPSPDGMISIVELREGRIPWYYSLEHPATTRTVAKGILEMGYEVTDSQGRRLTMDIYDTELSAQQRREVVMYYLEQWQRDLALNNNIDRLDTALAKTPNECHKCGQKGAADFVGLAPDRNWVCTKMLCVDCFQATPHSLNSSAFEWKVTGVHQPDLPAEWTT